MNYKESKAILQSIKQAKRILINCHEHPDADSVGGALAMAMVLKKMGKEVDIICPEAISEELKFLPGSKLIIQTDFSKINYSRYDLFLVLDTSSWDRVCGNSELTLPNIKIVQIDHHRSNKNYGEINLVDYTKKSNCEILYLVFEDWKVKINKNIAHCLLTGIIGDTGSFQFSTPPETLEAAAKLIRLGADKEEINLNLFRSMEFGNLKIIGELLRSIVLDKKGKFVWCAVQYKFVKDYEFELNLDVIDILLQGTKNTEFGVRMVEKNPEELRVSFRARADFDTSKIALALGGGGHPFASGATIKGLPFKEAVEKVLKATRKYTK